MGDKICKVNSVREQRILTALDSSFLPPSPLHDTGYRQKSVALSDVVNFFA